MTPGLPPVSLTIRLFLIVLGGVVLAMVLSNAFHEHERARWREEEREMTAMDHLTDTIRLLATLAPAARGPALGTLSAPAWQSKVDPVSDAAGGVVAPLFAERLAGRLDHSALVEGAWIDWSTDCQASPKCPKAFSVQLRFPDAQKIALAYTTAARGSAPRPLWRVLRARDFFEISVIAVVVWMVIRLALRPLERMTRAVEDFGRDIAHPALPVAGPIEVTRASKAFNTMQEQIRGFMTERTQILAAVTHDLKTPMTRLRLRLENCADAALKQKLCGDLADMQALVDEGLELARSMDNVEPAQPVDLYALLQSLCDDLAESGLPVNLQETATPAGLVVTAQPKALRRVLENIIDNAIKYGQAAHVTVEQIGHKAWIQVRDSGPGIPEEHLTAVLKPFVRLEGSRSRETGGTGLGLAIAANLLKAQQGEMRLDNRPEGGLMVSVGLPIMTGW